MVEQLRVIVAQPTRPPVNRRWLAVVRELVLASLIYELYNVIQAQLSGGATEALLNGSRIWHLERYLHLDPEPAMSRFFERVPPLGVAACYWYVSLHFLVTVGVLVFVFRWRPDAYRQARAVLAVMTLVALVVFWQFPAAPPHMLDSTLFRNVESHFSRWGWWDDGALPRHAAALENPFAAMPSLHVAWALWCGVTMARLTRRRGLRLLALAYPAITVVVVLGTSNHYLADVMAALLLWFVSDRIVARVIRASGGSWNGRRLFVCRVDPRELDDRRAQDGQQHDEHQPGARSESKVLVVHDVADDDAGDRVDGRRGRQARGQWAGLEGNLAEQ